MKRARGLVELRPAASGFTRRDFCVFAAASAAGLAIAGCTGSGTPAIQTGGLTGDDDGVDAGDHTDGGAIKHDGGTATDAGAAPTCPATGATDVGAPSSFTLNTPVYNSSIKSFVVRDAGGLYAMTAICTHEGATCEVQGSEIYCPRHGAEFSFDGDVEKGPATKPLVHYSMCTLANGHVGVVTSMTVSESTRLDA